VVAIGCGSPPETVDATAPVPEPPPPVSVVPAPTSVIVPPVCPADMQYVDTQYCADIDRRCLNVEHERTNHIDICHAFAREQRCRGADEPIAFCVDRYEYPNQAGAHPVWMLDWYEAQATCESKGKRLCSSKEWTAACEGPEHTPFPYGFERDHGKCNMDNFYVEPLRPGPRSQFFFYSKDKDVAFRELSRLDQSVPSGSIETCKSAFGVYDMTGNLDEWVVSDEAPRDKSRWAGLKGGAWGHVRSQCRPMTTSHEPEFRYYFVGFRCCRDAVGRPAWKPSAGAESPPAVEPHDFAPAAIAPADPPGPSKTKFTWIPR
jgi:formylglycine-generating enzyme